MDEPSSRRELEAQWLERVKQARAHYQERAAICQAVMSERARYPIARIADPDGAFALQHALRLESHALQEYMRALQVFTNLVVHGIVPREEDTGA